jgi:hypothetical protein
MFLLQTMIVVKDKRGREEIPDDHGMDYVLEPRPALQIFQASDCSSARTEAQQKRGLRPF